MNAAKRFIVMMGTDMRAPGGMTACVQSYQAAGLFERWDIRYLPSFYRKKTANKLWMAAQALLRFSAWLLMNRVAGLHVHAAARGSLWRKAMFVCLARWRGVPTVFHLHDGSFPAWYEQELSPKSQAAVRWVLRSADRVVVLSEGWGEALRRIEPAARIHPIQNPVMIPAAELAHAESGRILFLGRLWPEKGIYELLEAMAQLLRRWPQLELVCAGDGDLAAVQARIQTLGLQGRVRLTGWLDEQQKNQELARASLFVLPSYFEGVPIGILEAMAWSVPVVASDVGGVAEALNGEAGLLCAPGDVPSLVLAMSQVLENPELAQSLGRAGRARVLKVHDMHRVVDRLSGLYMELGLTLRDSGAGPRDAGLAGQ
ncbi:glycosyltransferase family 4 protein [Paucibacter sp. AS339]|uniref:glycosyltransferase family 4 protein n=1 Tax=Paucibacter hankyongi TaxID=3133434 RepID=UPI0030A07920